MKNELLDLINSYDHPTELNSNEIADVLACVENLTHRQIKNAICALLDQYESLKKGYKVSKGKNLSAMEQLKNELKHGSINRNQTAKELIQMLDELGYDVKRKDETFIKIAINELPIQIKNAISAKNMGYEERKALILKQLKEV